MTAPRAVALYGGSFDPPHHGHVMAATFALGLGRFDEVRLVPAFGHPFGKRMSPFDLRCRMVEAAVAHLGDAVRVEPIEASLPSPSYTVDTVRALLARERLAPTLVMGADSYASRHAWREWAALERLVDLLLIGRAGVADPPDAPVATRLPDLSSTEVRRRVAAGEPIGWMVPPAVEALIDAHGLYR